MPTSARQSVPLFEKIFGEFAAVKQADDSVRPQNARLFSEILGEFVTSQQADVGIGPYNWRIGALPPVLAVHICQVILSVRPASGGVHVL